MMKMLLHNYKAWWRTITIMTSLWILVQSVSGSTSYNDPFCNRAGDLKEVNGTFQCTCHDDYSGIKCETYIPCISSPCVNGWCDDDRNGGWICKCKSGYTGITCNEDIDECASQPCQHGSCTNGVARYDCTCDELYKGRQCDKYALCHPSPCDEGWCVKNGTDGFNCICEPGYTGTLCDEVITEPTTTTEESSTTTTAEASTAGITETSTTTTPEPAEPQTKEDSMDKAQVLGIGIASGLAISGIAVAAVKGFTFIKWKTGSGLSSMGTNQVNDMRYRLPKGSRNKPMRNGEGRNESKKDGDNISMRSLASKGSTVSLMGRYSDFITAEVTFWDDMHVRRHSEALKDVQPAKRPWCPVIETLI